MSEEIRSDGVSSETTQDKLDRNHGLGQAMPQEKRLLTIKDIEEAEIVSLEFVVSLENGQSIQPSLGSVLHGLIMQCIDTAYAEELHHCQIVPYHQYIYYDQDQQRAIWRVNAFSKAAVENIIRPIYHLPSKILLKQKGCHLLIEECHIVLATDYKGLAAQFLEHGEIYRKASFQFLTCTSFKSDGEYMIFPDATRLYKGVIKRWNAFSTTEVFEYDELIEALCDHVYVMDYQLRMQKFSIDRKGVVQGFKGSYVLGFKRNTVLTRLAALMSYFGSLCGVGIKPALGMGAVQVALEPVSHRSDTK